jgi:hypothetical protein
VNKLAIFGVSGNNRPLAVRERLDRSSESIEPQTGCTGPRAGAVAGEALRKDLSDVPIEVDLLSAFRRILRAQYACREQRARRNTGKKSQSTPNHTLV